jgi:hypothetical protein
MSTGVDERAFDGVGRGPEFAAAEDPTTETIAPHTKELTHTTRPN